MAGKKQKTGKKVAVKENDPEPVEVKTSDPLRSDSPQESEPHSQSAQPTVTTTETIKVRKSGGPRSVCAMYKVVVKKALGKKMKVTYNERGIPCGSTRHTLQSYIGMLARTMVPIDIANWPSVSRELKQKLWLDVQETFNIDPETERQVLKSAGAKWRQFKTKLTKNYVMPFVGQKKKLARPPKQYSFVGRDKWKNFVKSRITEDWLEVSKKQSHIVKKRKYPHRTSRKGYIGLEEEEIKSGKIHEGEVVDRAILWKKARIPKDGKIDEELEEINNKIDSLLEQKRKGEFIPSGSQDVLTTALQTPEHSGRVRGVGGFITPTVFFNLPRERRVRVTKAELLARDRQRADEMEKTKQELMSEIAQLKALISQSHLNSPILSDKASCNPEKVSCDQATKIKPVAAKGLALDNDNECIDIPAPFPPASAKDPIRCELAVASRDNKVAFGLMFPGADMSEKIHGKSIPSGCVRVSVDGSIKGETLLPVPVVGEMETVDDAIGSHVAWPKDLIIFTKPEIKKKEVVVDKKAQLQKMKALLAAKEPNENVPHGFRLLYKHVSTTMKITGESLQLPCDVEVFGVAKTIFVLHENILALLEYTMIGQAVLSTYMFYLHSVIRKNPELDETFAFIDPVATYNINADFVPYVVKRLREGNADRIFFLPHNHNMHWILAIIWHGDIYILNPLSHPLRFPDLEKALISAVKTFNAETGRGNRVPKVKPLAGSPKQPGGHECGYVVMRYMKEIIEDTDLTFATRWLNKSRSSFYSRAELDEVRIEALTFIQDHIS